MTPIIDAKGDELTKKKKSMKWKPLNILKTIYSAQKYKTDTLPDPLINAKQKRREYRYEEFSSKKVQYVTDAMIERRKDTS